MPANDDADLSSPLTRRGASNGTSPLQVSFEFFPPTDPEMEATLSRSIRRLEPLAPRFVSVTCGADGSTRDRTVEVVRRIRAQSSLTVTPHVTSIGLSRDELRELVRNYWDAGIRHLVALRGDSPIATSVDPLTPIEMRARAGALPGADVCRTGIEVVETVRGVAPFDVSVAAYPEGHPEARSAREDLDHLKRKLDAGASRAITQFFYDNEVYLRFRDACARSGIRAPIVPGILPIHKFRQVKRLARRCGTSIPEWLENRFAGLDEDAETSRLLGAAVAVEQVEFLRRHGVSEYHFYTLNRAELTYAVCHALGVRETRVLPSAQGA